MKIGILTILLVVSANVLAQSEPLKIVAFGDSITAPRKGLTVYSDILQKEFGDAAKVINAGIGGNTTAHAIARFEKDVLAHEPDLVIMQFGNNDSAVDVWKDPPAEEPRVSLKDYEKNLRKMIKAIKKKGAKIILVTPLPTRWTPKLKEVYGKPPYDPNDPNGFNFMKTKYVGKLRKIAKSERLPLIDLYAKYFEFDAAEGQTMDELFVDGMHPNNKGHRTEAELLIKQIRAMGLGN